MFSFIVSPTGIEPASAGSAHHIYEEKYEQSLKDEA
jgi:hypothetical protein